MDESDDRKRQSETLSRGINPSRTLALPDDLSSSTCRVHTTTSPWTGHTTPIDYNFSCLVDTRPSAPFILLAHLIAPFVEIDLMFSPA